MHSLPAAAPIFSALSLFAIAYGVIVSEKINKTIVALLGAGILIALRIVPIERLIAHIDSNVIFLLMFMMILVRIAERSGFFEWIAIWTAKRVRAHPLWILIALFAVTALLSALLDNVTTILLVMPISILIARQLEIDATPFLISQVLASNIGGTATLIGDPPNIMIGSAAGLSFTTFLVHLLPITLIEIVAVAAGMALIFRSKMKTTALCRARIMSMDEKKLIRDTTLLRKSLIALGATFGGFLFHGALHLEASIIALMGAVGLMLWSKEDVEALLKEVEWSTLLFFIGLFIMVGGLVETGCIRYVANFLITIVNGNPLLLSQTLVWSSGLLSGIIDNIPMVATFIPVIKDLHNAMGDSSDTFWWSLALGACLGGNLTAIGASANVIMISVAKKNGVSISFIKFMRYGIPVTLATLAMSSLYIWIRYFIIQ